MKIKKEELILLTATVIIIGLFLANTAIRKAYFKFSRLEKELILNEEKLLQLPEDARKALQRNAVNGGEVAIGLRAPDTQAAVNIWLNTLNINVLESEKQPRKKATHSVVY